MKKEMKSLYVILQSATWSREGEVLLFAMEGDPLLYSIKFTSSHSALPSSPGLPGLEKQSPAALGMAMEVADLSDVTLTMPDGEGVK